LLEIFHAESGGIAGRSTPGYLLASPRDESNGALHGHCKKVICAQFKSKAACVLNCGGAPPLSPAIILPSIILSGGLTESWLAE
jgi:hypothetical protein